MLVRDFLKNVSPKMQTIIWDLDAEPGNNKKVDDAGAFSIAYHYNYNSVISHFQVEPDQLTIWTNRIN